MLNFTLPQDLYAATMLMSVTKFMTFQQKTTTTMTFKYAVAVVVACNMGCIILTLRQANEKQI